MLDQNRIGLEPRSLVRDARGEIILRRERRARRAAVVREAVQKLGEFDRSVVEKYYFEGRSTYQISLELGCSQQIIRTRHSIALKKLHHLLARFAEEEFGISVRRSHCPICNSRRRRQIDKYLLSHCFEGSMRRLIDHLKNRFKIKVKSTMSIVGHIKYHI